MPDDVAQEVVRLPMSGEQVPDRPPWKVGEFEPLTCWWRHFTGSVVRSAVNAGALESRREGPRGGVWFAATDKWPEWARDYRERSRKRAEGIAAAEAERRLAPPLYCSSCKWWEWGEVVRHYRCTRPGGGARKSGRTGTIACRKFYEPKAVTPLSDDLRRGGP